MHQARHGFQWIGRAVVLDTLQQRRGAVADPRYRDLDLFSSIAPLVTLSSIQGSPLVFVRRWSSRVSRVPLHLSRRPLLQTATFVLQELVNPRDVAHDGFSRVFGDGALVGVELPICGAQAIRPFANDQ